MTQFQLNCLQSSTSQVKEEFQKFFEGATVPDEPLFLQDEWRQEEQDVLPPLFKRDEEEEKKEAVIESVSEEVSPDMIRQLK